MPDNVTNIPAEVKFFLNPPPFWTGVIFAIVGFLLFLSHVSGVIRLFGLIVCLVALALTYRCVLLIEHSDNNYLLINHQGVTRTCLGQQLFQYGWEDIIGMQVVFLTGIAYDGIRPFYFHFAPFADTNIQFSFRDGRIKHLPTHNFYASAYDMVEAIKAWRQYHLPAMDMLSEPNISIKS